jgi:hypothetical protein
MRVTRFISVPLEHIHDRHNAYTVLTQHKQFSCNYCHFEYLTNIFMQIVLFIRQVVFLFKQQIAASTKFTKDKEK